MAGALPVDMLDTAQHMASRGPFLVAKEVLPALVVPARDLLTAMSVLNVQPDGGAPGRWRASFRTPPPGTDQARDGDQ